MEEASNPIDFSCPQCGEKVFKTTTEVQRLEDFDGAVCTGCGHTISEEDIRAKAMQVVEDLLRGLGKG